MISLPEDVFSLICDFKKQLLVHKINQEILSVHRHEFQLNLNPLGVWSSVTWKGDLRRHRNWFCNWCGEQFNPSALHSLQQRRRCFVSGFRHSSD